MRARLLLAWVIAILGAACGSSSVSVTTPTTAKCNISVTNSVTGSMPAAGGNGVLSLTTTRDCSWSASSTASWISLAAPTSGQGSASLTYSVAANTQPAQRNATIDVSSNSTTIVQDPAPCRYVLTTPNGTTVPAGGGSLTVGVQTLSGCAWNAASDSGWIAFAGSAVGNGPATVAVNVGANTGAARSGNVTIGGQAVTIQQPGPPPPPPTPPPPSPPPPSPPPPPTPPPPSPPPPTPPPACTFSISPNSLNLGAGGGRGRASVTAGAGCNWTVSSSDSWIVVDQGSSSGQGNGTVTFSVSENHGAARTGALIIAGQSFTVSQAGDTPPPPPVCSFTISPTSKRLGADGGSDSVTVSASASSCSWTASSSAEWISVKDGASGHGDSKVSYSVGKNKQEGSRTGTLTIAGKTFTVTEDGQGQGGS